MADISVKLAVDGEKTFRTSLQRATAEAKKFSAQLKTAEAAMKAGDKSEKTAAQRAEALQGVYEANQEKLRLYGEEIERANAKLGELGKALDEAKKSGNAQDIEKATNAYNRQAAALAKLQGDASDAQGAMEQAKRRMDGLADSADDAKDDVNGLAQQLESVAEDSASAKGSLQSINTQVSFETVIGGLEKVADKITGVFQKAWSLSKQLWDLSKESSEWAKETQTAAQQMGVTTEEYQRLQYAAGVYGLTISDLTAGQDKLAEAGDDAAAVLNKLNVTYGEVDKNGNTAVSPDLLWDTIDALHELYVTEGSVAAKEAGMKLFGNESEYMKYIALVQSGTAAFREVGDGVSVVSDESVQTLADFNDELDAMENSLETAKIETLSSLAGGLSTIATAIKEVADKWTEWTKTEEGQAALEKLSNSIASIVTSLTEEGGFDAVVNAASAAITGLSNAFQWIADHGGLTAGVISSIAASLGVIKVTSGITQAIKFFNAAKALIAGGGGQAAANAVTDIVNAVNGTGTSAGTGAAASGAASAAGSGAAAAGTGAASGAAATAAAAAPYVLAAAAVIGTGYILDKNATERHVAVEERDLSLLTDKLQVAIENDAEAAEKLQAAVDSSDPDAVVAAVEDITGITVKQTAAETVQAVAEQAQGQAGTGVYAGELSNDQIELRDLLLGEMELNGADLSDLGAVAQTAANALEDFDLWFSRNEYTSDLFNGYRQQGDGWQDKARQDIQAVLNSLVSGVAVDEIDNGRDYATEYLDWLDELENATSETAAYVDESLQGVPASMRWSGQQGGIGFAKGLLDESKLVFNAGSTLGSQADMGIRFAADINSPSKVTERLGKYMGEGLALGMDSTHELVRQSAANMIDLTAPTSSAMMAQSQAANVSVNNDNRGLAEAIAAGLRGLTVEMDGETVGRLVTPTVDEELGNLAYAGRYARG